MMTINGKIPIADTPEKKLRRLAMLVRAISQSIEGSDAVSDTIWLTDTETVCDALFRAADEIIDVADCLPNTTIDRTGHTRIGSEGSIKIDRADDSIASGATGV